MLISHLYKSKSFYEVILKILMAKSGTRSSWRRNEDSVHLVEAIYVIKQRLLLLQVHKITFTFYMILKHLPLFLLFLVVFCFKFYFYCSFTEHNFRKTSLQENKTSNTFNFLSFCP